MSQWGVGSGNKLHRQKKGPWSLGKIKAKLTGLEEDQAEGKMLKDGGRKSSTRPSVWRSWEDPNRILISFPGVSF